MGLKAWLGNHFLTLGFRLLGVPKDLEVKDVTFDIPNAPVSEPEEEDYDVALAAPVVLSSRAQEMILQGRPMPPPPPPPPPPPLKGSIAERILLERQRLQPRGVRR